MPAKFSLEIPLDASGIEGFKPEQPVKVLVRNAKGVQSQNVGLNEKGQGSATFTFPEEPGTVHIVVGPATASDEELEGLQTLTLDISARQVGDKPALKLPPILIPPYFWWWWLIWCRQFVIRGRVICPDGSPVPGAKVCAFDVDWWFIWVSTQQVGCAFTDANGAFEIRFRWCCGWWPWWWWRFRVWEINASLVDRVSAVLKRVPDVRLAAPAGNQPTLAVFDQILAQGGVPTTAIAPKNLNQLEAVRGQLLEKLPAAADLAAFRIWPWWPWFPWWDCTPDIIFKVTQDCVVPGAVIVNETIFNTRWDIPNPLNVTLVANQNACCRTTCPEPPCVDGECLVITQVCGEPIDDIGGNIGAPVAPVGYLHPGAVAPGVPAYNGDRPFAGTIPVVKNFGAMLNVDYYEIEQFDGVNWVPLPPGAAVNFQRQYMHMVAPFFPTTNVPFDFVTISGHSVVESKEHWEANSGLGIWGFNYVWILNEYLVVPLDTTQFTDGPHSFRVVGWQIQAGNLVNRRVMPLCGTNQDNGLVLFFDNRVITSFGHPILHNCGGLHVCTLEPDTSVDQVLINGQPVAPCGTVDAAAGDLQVDFSVTDPDGHLAEYTIVVEYGLNQSVNLLSLAGASVTPIVPGTPTGWLLAQGVATYGAALSQGAVAPHWYGGSFRLTVPASQAFPQPCCYQLRLEAHKRNIVGGGSGIQFICDPNYPFYNLTEMTLGVGVCPPPIHRIG